MTRVLSLHQLRDAASMQLCSMRRQVISTAMRSVVRLPPAGCEQPSHAPWSARPVCLRLLQQLYVAYGGREGSRTLWLGQIRCPLCHVTHHDSAYPAWLAFYSAAVIESGWLACCVAAASNARRLGSCVQGGGRSLQPAQNCSA